MRYNRYTAAMFDELEEATPEPAPEWVIIEGTKGRLYYIADGEVTVF